MTCPTYDELLAWIEAGLPGAATASGHAPGDCPDCRRRLSVLNELTSTMGQPAPEPVPAALRQSTLMALAAADAELAKPAAEKGPSLLSTALDRIQEFVAELVDMTTSPGLAVGLRGDDDDVQSFQAGPFTLDVGLVDRRALMGQLTDANDEEAGDLAGAECILCGADGVIESTLTEEGGFRFDDAGPGRYALMIESSDVRLLFPDIDLSGV
jgi:hypothetical protein